MFSCIIFKRACYIFLKIMLVMYFCDLYMNRLKNNVYKTIRVDTAPVTLWLLWELYAVYNVYSVKISVHLTLTNSSRIAR